MKRADLERADKEAHAAYKVACDIAEDTERKCGWVVNNTYRTPTNAELDAIKMASDKADEAMRAWVLARLRLLGKM